MNIDAKNAPLDAELLYQYLLNTELFPIGYEGSSEQYLERIKREHKSRGGEPCTATKPLKLIKSCLKNLKLLGFYQRRFRRRWERVEIIISTNNQRSDLFPILIGVITASTILSSKDS